MSDRPRDNDEGTREFGSEAERDDSEQTRHMPWKSTRGGEEEAPTRFAPNDARRSSGEESGTRRISSSGAEREAREPVYPRGQFEAAGERHERLRKMYGGVDWLASFIGFLFAVIAGAFFSLIAGIVLAPLGFSPGLGGGLGTATITAFVVVGILIFLTCFCGGYVAGRLARFDGGRNGAVVVAWALVVSLLSFAVFGFLPGQFSDLIREITQERLFPALRGLQGIRLAGAAIILAGLALAILGGFVGGRAGSRYHTDIDRTS